MVIEIYHQHHYAQGATIRPQKIGFILQTVRRRGVSILTDGHSKFGPKKKIGIEANDSINHSRRTNRQQCHERLMQTCPVFYQDTQEKVRKNNKNLLQCPFDGLPGFNRHEQRTKKVERSVSHQQIVRPSPTDRLVALLPEKQDTNAQDPANYMLRPCFQTANFDIKPGSG